MMRAFAAGLLALSTALVAVASARAAVSSRLTYSRMGGAATACSDESAFRAAVKERLGYDPFFPWAPQVVSVEIDEADRRLRGRLRLIDAEGIVRGARELTSSGRECTELVNSLALATSIALDPMAGAPSGPSTSSPPVTSPDPDRAPSSANEPPKPPTPPPPSALRRVESDPPHEPSRPIELPITLEVRAGPLAAIGMGPSMTVGGRLGILLRKAPFGLAFELRGDLPASAASSGEGRVDAQFLGGAFAPCVSHSFLAACGLFLAGAMRMNGVGVADARRESFAYLAAGLRLEASFRLAPWSDLLLNVDGHKTLNLARVRLAGVEVWETPPVSLVLGLALGFHLP